jgi:multidrug transporter EmrE-like cation transporter
MFPESQYIFDIPYQKSFWFLHNFCNILSMKCNPTQKQEALFMYYIYLALGILTEICGSTLLKFTDGFRKKYLAVLCLAAYGIAYYMVALSMQVLPLNIAYATWSGAGTLLTMLIGMTLFKERFRLSGYLGLLLLLGGIIALNLCSF